MAEIRNLSVLFFLLFCFLSAPLAADNLKLDINTATLEELMQIKGVGKVIAERIISERDENGLFKDIDDLLRVKGIGPKSLDKMRDFISVSKKKE